jgi:hypothetical protein
VNQNDIVPHVVSDKLFDYRHGPVEMWFKSNQYEYQLCDGTGEDPKCSYSVPIWRFSVEDHMNYVGHNLNNNTNC